MNVTLAHARLPAKRAPFYIAKYAFPEKDTLAIWPMNSSEVEKAIKGRRLRGNLSDQGNRQDVTVTDSNANVAKYLLGADHDKLFGGAIILRKIHHAERTSPLDVGPEEAGKKRNGKPNWAIPIEKPGLPNLHKVTENLYRGAQPSAEGFWQLKQMGVKTVVNLRSFHSDRDELGETGLAYEHIYMKTWHPEDEEVVRFLQIVMDRDRTPVFVHCQQGADRTGLMCAVYRVAMCGWTKEEAIEEMTSDEFGFHGIWDNLADYLKELDIEELKRRAESAK